MLIESLPFLTLSDRFKTTTFIEYKLNQSIRQMFSQKKYNEFHKFLISNIIINNHAVVMHCTYNNPS